MRVLVFGTFDELHPGHHYVLKQALKRGELHVIVARDTNVRRIKGRDAMQNQDERIAAIREAFPDAHVALGDPTDFRAPLAAIQPDLVLLGYDQKLPPGVSPDDIHCAIERLPAFKPTKYKSSLLRQSKDK